MEIRFTAHNPLQQCGGECTVSVNQLLSSCISLLHHFIYIEGMFLVVQPSVNNKLQKKRK